MYIYQSTQPLLKMLSNMIFIINILNATFEGANLNNAVWIDGTKCLLGSIGKCNK